MPGESTSTYHHEPVMVTEVVAIFEPVPAGVLIDATVGGGGHTAALLEALRQIEALGLDRDPDAVGASTKALRRFGSRARVRHARFDLLAETAGALGLHRIVGVLFDLGVSSPQLDRPARGFSYRHDGPLDMRMDTSAEDVPRDPRNEPGSTRTGTEVSDVSDVSGVSGAPARTAADVVNGYAHAELARVIADYGDERYASRIATAIVAARPLHTTTELAAVVRDAIPMPARRRGGHPAKRTFQAIRIEVNDELRILADAIDQGVEVLAPRGRIAVLSYHSGEDRIVKQRLRHAETGGCTCPPRLPCACGAVPRVRLLTRGARKPSAAEIAANPRAESARLRSAEKLEPAGSAT